MYNPKFVMENERHKPLCDSEIQAESPNLDQTTIVHKRERERESLPNSGLCRPVRP